MTEDELREIVREAVRRRIGREGPAGEDAPLVPVFREHASHALLPVPRGADGDGPCLIEPSVRCNHCGYCVSYGH